MTKLKKINVTVIDNKQVKKVTTTDSDVKKKLQEKAEAEGCEFC